MKKGIALNEWKWCAVDLLTLVMTWSLAIVYAFYVPANMVLFWSLHQLPPPTVGFIVVYLFLSLTGSVGTAIYLAYHRERLS